MTPEQLWNEFGYPPHLQRLISLVDQGTLLNQRPLTYSPTSMEEAEVFSSVMPLVRRGMEIGDGARVLLIQAMPGPVAPLERALFEIWVEVKYILDSDDRVTLVRMKQIGAVLETIAFLQDRGADSKSTELALAELKRVYPSLVAQVADNRKNRRFHWSGLSRSALIKEVCGPKGLMMYKYLSWGAHAELVHVTDVSISPDYRSIEFADLGEHAADRIEHLARVIGGRMSTLWNTAATAFRLPQFKAVVDTTDVIVVPPEPSPVESPEST